MNIEYRDASYRERRGERKIRRIEASFGRMSAHGANRTEAKANLLADIERQLAHVYARRYLSANDVTFCLYYANGWSYDIVRGERDLGQRSSSTMMGGEPSETEAFESMKRHFEQYAIVGRELDLGVDRTDGELRRAMDAWNAEQSHENLKRWEAAQAVHVALFYAAQEGRANCTCGAPATWIHPRTGEPSCQHPACVMWQS